MNNFLPIGKLPVKFLGDLLDKIPITDPRVILGPGVGLDCTVIDVGSSLLVLKTDPITFTSKNIGWYAVNINANDIATTAAVPQWMLATLLLPELRTTSELVEQILDQIIQACVEIGVSLVGGHTGDSNFRRHHLDSIYLKDRKKQKRCLTERRKRLEKRLSLP